MKKIILSIFGIGCSFFLSAQQYNVEDLKSSIRENSTNETLEDYEQKLASYYLTNNDVEELESFALEIKDVNPKAYAKFNWDLMNHYLSVDQNKYEYYAQLTKKCHPNNPYIADALKFNEINLRISKLGRFVSGDKIQPVDKEALYNLSQSTTFYGSVACEHYFLYFNEKPCHAAKTTEQNAPIVSSTSSIEQVQSKMSVFPNPSENGIFNVELEGFGTQKQIEVFNTIGAKVWEKSTSNDLLTIELSDLKDGVYFIRVNDSSNSKTERILIQ